jgi:hypothetical protein
VSSPRGKALRYTMSVSLVKDEDGFIFSGKLYLLVLLYAYIDIAIAPSDATTDPNPAGPSELEHGFGETFLSLNALYRQ